MPAAKRIVCLANSRKLNGRCIAGRELFDDGVGPWIRPVSEREHEEVSEYERQYQDGSDPKVLDIIHVPVLGPRPRAYQSENWLIEAGWYWIKVGQVGYPDLINLVDPVGPLWLNGGSTYNGLNDEIPLDQAERLGQSLTLIQVDALRISVYSPGASFGNPKRRVQAQFTYGGVEYHLWVTDPAYERTFLAEPNGTYDLGPCFLTVSLGEPYQDCVYKLVAAIIQEPA